ncbi:MAG: hypothetical protein AB7E26_02390 [Chryseobacterium sp.]
MKKLIFVLFSSVCFGQTDQYKQILLTKKIGREIRSYSKGYGVFTEARTGNTGIVDSLGNITFAYPLKSEISRLWKDRFILKVKAGNSNGKTALIDEKGKELIPLDNFRFRTWENKDRMISQNRVRNACMISMETRLFLFPTRLNLPVKADFLLRKTESG